MSGKYEDANLILKLYDLRREEVMRKARAWFIGEFHPGNIQDVEAAAMGEQGAYYRMVTTYWDMACSFITNGVLNEKMFNDAGGEHLAVYCKIEPFVAEIREKMGMPNYLQHLEQVVMNIPNAGERMTKAREMFKQMAAKRAAAQG